MTNRRVPQPSLLTLTLLLACSGGMDALAEDSQAEIAKKLNNPIAAMVSVPLQLNHDENIGKTDAGERDVLNIQPVVPIDLNADWNIISRTILPVIQQNDIPRGTDRSGIGDVLQSLFFSPKAPTAGGWIWGAGPALLLPTASDELLGGEKWSAGPTAVILKQENGWTYGVLANHLWSFAGDGQREDVSATFLQPILGYTTATLTTFSLNSESVYDWEAKEWSVPINLMATQLFKVGEQPMSIQLGTRYWAESPDAGAGGWGWRLTYTLVFRK
ncbi:MAG: hypothetical protein CVV19_01410 [Gammaproteobacteria bacterium HGW-Gammaproteobacteria-9]|nr:MAG: hypothetical protein CVV19_01410 [Gammaproteobacteria bacterium HGW-Gammaproteobacteria-9]